MARPDKPKPIRNHKAKSHGWHRPAPDGFVTHRLNKEIVNTEAVGFVDYREYEWDGGTYYKRTPC